MVCDGNYKMDTNPSYQNTSVNGNYFLFLRDDGRVQIGNMTQLASSPHNDFKLSVDGKIVTRKLITTQLNWADEEWIKK